MTAPPMDFLSPAFYGEGAREVYAWLRANSPVHFDENSGLWGIASHEGVRAAGRDADTFSSAGGSRPDSGPLPWMIDLDAPDHRKRRKLVSRGFTPRRVQASAGRLERICDELIDRVCQRGECEFVRDLAAPLPMIVIGDMLGVPPADRDELLRWSDDLIGSLNGATEGRAAAAAAFGAFDAYARSLIASRRGQPGEDLVSVLAHAEVDGDRLSDDEIVFETLLLLLGGDETTRHVTSGGMEQLLRHPDQRRKLLDDPRRIPAAIEEMLRWVSPIKNMARTVRRDVDFLGRRLRAGQKVVLLYEAANFDEAHFEGPEAFRVERAPNDHVAFGFGPHICLGASLARLELRCMFERLLARLPDLSLAGDEPPRSYATGISEMPVRFTPSPPLGPC